MINACVIRDEYNHAKKETEIHTQREMNTKHKKKRNGAEVNSIGISNVE